MVCAFSKETPYLLKFFFLFTVRIYDLLWNIHASHGISIFLCIGVTRLRMSKSTQNYTYSYEVYWCMSRIKLTTLHERRSVLCNRFFSNMISPSHKLNGLVPPKKLFTYNLIGHTALLEPKCRTERFSNSFDPAATRAYNIIKKS